MLEREVLLCLRDFCEKKIINTATKDFFFRLLEPAIFT